MLVHTPMVEEQNNHPINLQPHQEIVHQEGKLVKLLPEELDIKINQVISLLFLFRITKHRELDDINVEN